MKRFFTLSVMMFVIIVFSYKATSQTAPLYSFTSYSLDSGTALTTGAVYRFSNVYTGVDAFIKVIAISGGMTLRDIDRTADGYAVAFQPEYRVSANTNGYIDFKITFVNAGTNTVVTRPLVSATGLDIDGTTSSGNTLKEFNRIDMGSGTAEYNSYSSELIISQTGTEFTGANNTGNLYGALVDTSAKEVMYTVTAANVSTITYRVGANNQTTGNSTRYASLYFKKFNYQHFPLAISSLYSFSGYSEKNKVTLNWDIATGGIQKLELERSYNSADFSAIAEYQVAALEGSAEHFSYTDNRISGNLIFYRLKSISESGKVAYSDILSFKVATANTGKLTVFPTMVQSTANVSISAPEQTVGYLQVTDFNGRVVKQQQLMLKKGNNSIVVSGFESLSKGNYIVSVRTTSDLLSKQVVVQ